MARFIKHGPCKKCGSRDNLGIYDDGSTFCFGCRAYSKPTRRVDYAPEEKKVMNIQGTLSSKIPEENRVWLGQYLTDEQIDEYFGWSESLGRHVYAENLSDDSVYWEARIVGGKDGVPKVISGGSKPYSLRGAWKETGVVCIVEDIVSAIKLQDLVGVVCLHGSTIPNSLYAKIGNLPVIKTVLVWLDRDKLSPAAMYANKFRVWGKETMLIMTPKDPKAYNLNEIKEILKGAI